MSGAEKLNKYEQMMNSLDTYQGIQISDCNDDLMEMAPERTKILDEMVDIILPYSDENPDRDEFKIIIRDKIRSHFDTEQLRDIKNMPMRHNYELEFMKQKLEEIKKISLMS